MEGIDVTRLVHINVYAALSHAYRVVQDVVIPRLDIADGVCLRESCVLLVGDFHLGLQVYGGEVAGALLLTHLENQRSDGGFGCSGLLFGFVLPDRHGSCFKVLLERFVEVDRDLYIG